MSVRLRAVGMITVSVVVLGLLVLGGTRLWAHLHRSNFSRSLEVVPASTLRLSFTDWAAVRQDLNIEPGANPSGSAVARLLGKAYDTDLSGVSSIDEAGVALQRYYGFSPATVDWEAYAQGREGATMVVRVSDDVDLDQVRSHLADLGYTKPAADDGVWKGGADVVAAIDPTITPELQYVAILADQHLIVTSDQAGYAAKAAAVARGDAPSLAGVGSDADLAASVDRPVAAMLWSGDFACADLAMSQASQEDQDSAAALIARAGKVTPLTGLVMALAPDRSLHVAEQFDSADQAKENLTARARLAVGDAPGRGGSFSDDLRLTSSGTAGSTVQLRFVARSGASFLLSGLDNGPVLFATC